MATPRWIIRCLLSGLLALSASLAHAVPITSTVESGTAQAPSSPMQAKMAEGLAALARNDLAAAEAAFTEALKLEPTSSRPHLGLAEVAGRRNDLKAAESWLKKGLAVEPGNAELMRVLARLEFNRGNYAAAEGVLKKAVALDPSSAWAHINLAENYLKGLKRPKDAADAYRQALALEADNLAARSGLGAALAAQGQIGQAITEYEAVARAAPGDPQPVHVIARLHASQGRLDQALQALERAIKIAPNYLAAHVERGDLLLAKGDVANAIVAYQTATGQAPNPAGAWFKLGSIYQAQRKWDEAEGAYLAAVKGDPRMYGAYNNLAWMSAERKARLDDALAWAKKAIEIAPRNDTLYDTLGWVHRARGELDLAAKAIGQAIAAAPAHPNHQFHLGMVYGDQGRKKEAIAALRKSLELGKKFPGGFPNAAEAARQLEKLGGK